MMINVRPLYLQGLPDARLFVTTVAMCHEETHAPQQDKDPLGLVLTRGPTTAGVMSQCEAGGLLMVTQMAFLGPRTSSYGVVDVAQPI